MTPAAVLIDAFQRVADSLPQIVDGLSEDDLSWRPAADANPIGWLVWHLLRVQDDHVADVAGSRPGVDRAGVRRSLRPALRARA